MKSDDRSYLIRKVTKLIGNTSFRTESYKHSDGPFQVVKVKDIAPNPHTGDYLGDPQLNQEHFDEAF
jgi:hypothetical protein